MPPEQVGRWIFIAITIVFGLYVLKAVRLSRESLRPILKRFILGFLIGLLYYAQWGKPSGDKPINNGIFFGALVAAVFHKKRSRHIPNAVKRAARARDFKGREHEYDPKKHHYHHKQPFARGGSHTLDNIRLIDKETNLKKGAKRPSLWDMFFR